jgi:hypothetical protein
MKDFDKVSSASEILDELKKEDKEPIPRPARKKKSRKSTSSTKLTSPQFFVISVLLFTFILIAGFFVLILTGKMFI